MAWQGPIHPVPWREVKGTGQDPYDAARLACDPERGYLYLAYTRARSVSAVTFDYTINLVRSLDGGQTWGAPLALSGTACNGASPVVGPDGELYVIWEDFASRQMVGRKSTDFGQSFGAPFAVGSVNDNLGAVPAGYIPMLDRRNPLYYSSYLFPPSFPSVAIDRGAGPRRGALYVAWNEHVGGTTGDAERGVYESEPNNGYAAATPIRPGDEVIGVAVSPDIGDDPDYFSVDGEAGSTLWIDGLVYCASPTPPYPVALCFQMVCGPDTLNLHELTQTCFQASGLGPMPPLIVTLPATGRYYLRTRASSYSSLCYYLRVREWRAASGEAARDQRDIVLASSSDGGASWSPKARVNDDPPRFDNALPSVAVDGSGNVHVAWYDRRDDPVCGVLAHTYWAFSTDGGASFRPSRRLSTQSGLWEEIQYTGNIGDHLAVAAAGNQAYVLWTQAGGFETHIYGVTIGDVFTSIAVPRFMAELSGVGVRVSWTVTDAHGIVGFRLSRAQGSSESFAPVGQALIPSRGESEYVESDGAVEPGHRYRYRLEVLRDGVASAWEGPVEVNVPAAVTRLSWKGVSPNPFVGAIRLELATPHSMEGTIRVYSVTGQEVATIHRGALPAGVTSYAWQGRDREGREAPAGVYIVRAEYGRESATMRVIRIR